MFGVCRSDQSIPIEQLDYKFIGSCKDVELLQKLIKILRSGEEGIFPDLTKFAEEQLRKFSPKNPLLEKKNPEKTSGELAEKERKSIVENLKGFVNNSKGTENEHAAFQDSSLPPVRSLKTVELDSNKENNTEQKKPEAVNKNKRVTPRSYDEWAKLDKEIEKDEGTISDDKVKEKKNIVNSKKQLTADEMLKDLNTEALQTSEDVAERAEREKNKGNEAFRSGDFEEALAYYNRSISLKAVASVHNNRAMAYIKLEKYEEAIKDCDCVLKDEPKNIKAYLRRGLAYQSLKKLECALKDFTTVVEIEPKNQRGKELYESTYKELERHNETGKKKGKRLVVEEIESQEREQKTSDNVKSANQTKSSSNRMVIEEVNSSSVAKPEPELKTLNEKNRVNTDPVTEEKSDTEKPSIETTGPAVPTFAPDKELPSESVQSKNEGNDLYRNGQYQDAYQKYTFSIQSLMTDPLNYKTALSSLFNNRAICQLKSGNCSECIRDCTKSIRYLPNIKALTRRATAYEHMEKYKDAYADYQMVYSKGQDPQISQAMSRIGKHLKADLGKDWHDNLPKRDDINWNSNANIEPSQAKVSSAPPKLETIKKPNVKNVTEKNEKKSLPVKEESSKEKTIQEQFLETKEKGNNFVKQGKYKEAIPFYTKCINLLPLEVPSYTNRALCYLKLKEVDPENAIDDCTQALKLQSGNIKALFRRAQSYRILKKYKETLGDLASILKEEPKNKAAQKEMDECKDLYRAELKELQSKTNITNSKKGKKMKIEEVSSESFSPTKNRPSRKQTTKTETCPMAKGSTSNVTTSRHSSLNNKKINAIEFMQMWNSIKSGKSSDYAEILRQIDPTKLPELLSNKIDGKILENFIRAISDHFTSKEYYKYGMTLMKSMYRVQRFSTMLMFLGTQEKTMLKSTIDVMENRVKQDGGERTLQNEISQLRSQYRCTQL